MLLQHMIKLLVVICRWSLGASDTPSDHSVGTTNNGKIGASTGGVVNRDFKGVYI